MVPPSPHRISAFAVPFLVIAAVGFVVAGVRLGGGVPIAEPRPPVSTSALSRPAAQIAAQSPSFADADLAAAIGSIGDLRPADDSPAASGAPPALVPSPQTAPAPGTSPPPGDLPPPSKGDTGSHPPDTAGTVTELLQSAVDTITPVTDPVTGPVEKTVGPSLPPVPPSVPVRMPVAVAPLG